MTVMLAIFVTRYLSPKWMIIQGRKPGENTSMPHVACRHQTLRLPLLCSGTIHNTIEAPVYPLVEDQPIVSAVQNMALHITLCKLCKFQLLLSF